MLTPSSPSHPSPIAIFTTTRGATPAQCGWISVFKVDEDGQVVPPPTAEAQTSFASANDAGVIRFETPTSSGKANALDIRAKRSDGEDGFWILLTDDDPQADQKGAVRVLEWNGWEGDSTLSVVAEWPSGDEAKGTKELEGVEFTGASHAIWLD